jgi:hypothetical protein
VVKLQISEARLVIVVVLALDSGNDGKAGVAIKVVILMIIVGQAPLL